MAVDYLLMHVGAETLHTALVVQIRSCVLRVQPIRRDVSQFIYFCKTLYVFQTGFSVHHQELKTAHTASDQYCYLPLAWPG